jgi:hypothetical protein
VLFFLGNGRATLISALSIPTSIIASFGVMWAADVSLNSISLVALALAVGIVIDDAIIVVENIFRFIEEKKQKPFDAAINGTKEIGLAVMATTFSLLAVFVPVAFLSGIVGKFLSSFGLTMSFAIAVSLLVSFTLAPSLSARMLKITKPNWIERGMARLVSTMTILARSIIARRSSTSTRRKGPQPGTCLSTSPKTSTDSRWGKIMKPSKRKRSIHPSASSRGRVQTALDNFNRSAGRPWGSIANCDEFDQWLLWMALKRLACLPTPANLDNLSKRWAELQRAARSTSDCGKFTTTNRTATRNRAAIRR